MVEVRNGYRNLVGNVEGGDHWKDEGVDLGTILKWILLK
jgi:hypothetical protein